MESRLADFCDVVWQRTLDAAIVAVGIKATSAVAVVPPSVEEMIGLTRLPRLLIEEAVGFAKQHAEVCLLSLGDVPSMPVPDPWDAQRQSDLEARVRRSIGQMIRLGQKHWGFSKDEAAVSQCAANTKLLGEVASQWEAGKRAYHKALQKGEATSSIPNKNLKEAKKKAGNKGRRNRGKTVEEALQDLLRTPEGVKSIFAARTIDGIADLIGFSHGSVAGSVAWRKEIKPMLVTLKSARCLARVEYDERRHHRRSDRRRK